MAWTLSPDGLVDPSDISWIALRRQGLRALNVLTEEGRLRPLDTMVLLLLAVHQSRVAGDSRVTIADLRRQLGRRSVGPISHSLRRLRAAELVARVGGERGRGFYVVSPAFSSCGNLRERQHHARLFKAALKQQAPIRPATPGDVAARHALPSQLAPAA